MKSTVFIIDVADLRALVVVGQFDNGNSASTHNLFVKDNLIFQANYASGVRVLDIEPDRRSR